MDTWVYFFEHGKEIDPDNPPEKLKTGIMRQVMTVMLGISQKQADLWAYHSRVDARRLRDSIAGDLADLEKKVEQAEKEVEQAEKEVEQA
ncbi:MAG: hypothetical protein GY807_13515, partial [Gammaproteobacteria bacterium]|nr:hypothetical protein [Gammaproteobacteria bacterium]